VAAAGPALAAEARLFRLPAEPIDRGLLRFGVQGGVSVGGLPAPGCGGTTHPVRGLMTPAQALARLLPPGCAFEQPDPGSFRIVAKAPAPAAPPPREVTPPSAVDQLIVTAQKRPEPLIGSPYAVSALPAAEVIRLGGLTFDDLASQMVSVAVTNLGPGRDKIFVRGLSDGSFTGRTQSTVGLYLDDVPITYNAPDPDLRLVDIDRVEVLRGPQGTLYGSGSMGGIVHIVTAAPDPNAFAGFVTAGAATTQRGAASSRIEGMLNLPLPLDAAVRGVAYSDTAGGYLDDPRIGRTDTNKSRRWGGRLAVAAPLPEDWRLRATFVHQSTDNADAQYTEGGTASQSRDVDVLEPSDNDFTEGEVSLLHPGGFADLKISAAFVDHLLQSQYDATGAFPGVAAATPTAFDENQKVTLGVVEADLTSNTAGHTRWLLGAFASEAREVDTGKLAVQGAPHRVSVFRRRDRLVEAALFGEATYDLTAELSVTAGLRWFATHRSAHAGDFDLSVPPIPAMDGEVTDRGLAPKLRVSYAFAPDVVVYAEAQKGFRAGGFNIPAAAAGVGTAHASLPAFDGDSLWNYEMGLVAPLLDHSLTLRAAMFHVDWRQLQTDQFTPSGLPMTVNVGDASDNGLEAEAVWRSGRHWQVRLNGLFADPQVVRVAGPFPARTDAGLPGVPNQLASADVRYRWTPWDGYEADVSAQVSYLGRSHVTFDATRPSLMGGYAVGDLNAELVSARWRLRAYLDNVAGTKANTFAFGNPFSRERALQVTPLRPRTFGLDLTWGF
jgi:outer membrane receptor protein involved in Fe transport